MSVGGSESDGYAFSMMHGELPILVSGGTQQLSDAASEALRQQERFETMRKQQQRARERKEAAEKARVAEALKRIEDYEQRMDRIKASNNRPRRAKPSKMPMSALSPERNTYLTHGSLEAAAKYVKRVQEQSEARAKPRRTGFDARTGLGYDAAFVRPVDTGPGRKREKMRLKSLAPSGAAVARRLLQQSESTPELSTRLPAVAQSVDRPDVAAPLATFPRVDASVDRGIMGFSPLHSFLDNSPKQRNERALLPELPHGRASEATGQRPLHQSSSALATLHHRGTMHSRPRDESNPPTIVSSSLLQRVDPAGGGGLMSPMWGGGPPSGPGQRESFLAIHPTAPDMRRGFPVNQRGQLSGLLQRRVGKQLSIGLKQEPQRQVHVPTPIPGANVSWSHAGQDITRRQGHLTPLAESGGGASAHTHVPTPMPGSEPVWQGGGRRTGPVTSLPSHAEDGTAEADTANSGSLMKLRGGRSLEIGVQQQSVHRIRKQSHTHVSTPMPGSGAAWQGSGRRLDPVTSLPSHAEECQATEGVKSVTVAHALDTGSHDGTSGYGGVRMAPLGSARSMLSIRSGTTLSSQDESPPLNSDVESRHQPRSRHMVHSPIRTPKHWGLGNSTQSYTPGQHVWSSANDAPTVPSARSEVQPWEVQDTQAGHSGHAAREPGQQPAAYHPHRMKSLASHEVRPAQSSNGNSAAGTWEASPRSSAALGGSDTDRSLQPGQRQRRHPRANTRPVVAASALSPKLNLAGTSPSTVAVSARWTVPASPH